MDRLTSMTVFVKAVDLGSFAAAAAALDLSSPMVGKHVRSLEDRLGTRLLNRTTRRQSLTEFGRAYYDRCRSVLAEVEAAEALAAHELSEPRGRLRVAAPAHFGRHCVASVMIALARRHPALELELSFNDRFVDLAEDGYDLAVRTGELEDRAGIISRSVSRQSMILCASPAYLAARGRPAVPDDLPAHDAVVYRRPGFALRPWLFPGEDGSPAVPVAPGGRLRLDDLDAIADAAATGMGLAWLPSWLIRDRLGTGDLVPVWPDRPAYPYDVHAIWLKTPHLPLRVRVAIDALAAELPALTI